MVEKRFQKISEPSLESQESNKTKKVQFRLRMTKNQHKQSKLPKLPFQQTETNEPDGSVCQPVQKVEKRFLKKFKTSLTKSGIQKYKRSTIPTPMTKNQHKRSKLPKLSFQQTEFNEPANLVSQPVQTVERGSKNLSDPSSRSQKNKKTNQVENQLRMTENQHKQRQRPELLFQQTEFSEPANLVSQPVQPVERGYKYFS